MRPVAGCRLSQPLCTLRFLAPSCPNRRASCLARARFSPSRNEGLSHSASSTSSPGTTALGRPSSSSEGSSSIAMTSAAAAALAAAVSQASPAWAEDLQPSAVPAGYLGGDLVVAGFFYTVVALLSVVSLGVSVQCCLLRARRMAAMRQPYACHAPPGMQYRWHAACLSSPFLPRAWHDAGAIKPADVLLGGLLSPDDVLPNACLACLLLSRHDSGAIPPADFLSLVHVCRLSTWA